MTGKRVLLALCAIGALAAILWLRQPEAPQPAPQPAPRLSPGLPPDLRTPKGQALTLGPLTPFQAKRIALPFTFEYPGNWTAGEELGEDRSYQQILILGPRNPDNTYSAGLTIRLLPTKQSGGTYENLDELAKQRRHQFTGGQGGVLQEQPTQLLGLRGIQLELQMDTRLARGPHGAVPTTLKSHLVLLAKDQQLIELIYSADAREYDRYHPAFDHLLRSLRLTR